LFISDPNAQLNMKTCPYCAEEIQDAAKICKHCKREIVSDPQTTKTKTKGDTKLILKIFGYLFGAFILVELTIALWPVMIPAIVGWYVWKKMKLSKRNKIIITATVTAVFFVAGYVSAYMNRAPSLTLSEPQNGTSVQAESITVVGKVNPSRSSVKINGKVVAVDKEGGFRQDAALTDEKNSISIEALNGDKTEVVSLTVNRIFTEAERAERDRIKAEAEAKQKAELEAQQKVQKEAAAKAAAEQAVYEKSKAGQLCKKNPTWSKEDCQNIADRFIWVGMTYDMLIAERGKPSSANPSNYGHGTSWQWCWSGYTPSCFYGGDDGIVTSYN
jgi:hypothetical protein